MVSNKNRLYIALYPSGATGDVTPEERQYRWGFLVGPKAEKSKEVPGTRYHVKNSIVTGWNYEELSLRDVQNTTTLLARLLIAKIEDDERLKEVFRTTPFVQNDPNWRCRTWVEQVLARIISDGGIVGTSQLDWRAIEQTGRDLEHA
ncbi:hypothetical protein VE01_05895 [Pseudogymnoascus verrucosus]|uniref:Uncharacterized protein n=1 Tax=Pseudogymnoascus verrucosus TaxID=342668 RepID=A0A1B8GIC7_9PEZI|nr:uncharacterized protein VE01_05895 [Pseudogymnoascus verrucosus]OBT95613.1 hypothetical protein VE01_05895 [Pseudogymnoascus verrucosus]